MAYSLSEENSSTAFPLPLSPYAVSLGFFTGPLDLLLHLVKQQEVSVAEVEMAHVCEQYLATVSQAAKLDLHLAAEYLVVAATLVALKSESLLPQQSFFLDGEALEEGSNFYEELRERLKRYEQVKAQARELNSLPQLGLSTFTRLDRSIFAPREGDGTTETETVHWHIGETTVSLGTAFVKLLRRIGTTLDSIRIQLDPVSIVDYMMRIVGLFEPAEPKSVDEQKVELQKPQTFLQTLVSLARNFGNQSKPTHARGETGAACKPVRGMVIGSFMALLELIRRGIVSVQQQDDSGEISMNLEISPGGTIDQLSLEDEDALDDRVVPLRRLEPVTFYQAKLEEVVGE